jgi:hypothetical protein
MLRQFEKLYLSILEDSLNEGSIRTGCLLPCSYREYKIAGTEIDVVNRCIISDS